VYVNRDTTGPLPSHWPWLPRISFKYSGVGLWSRWISLGFAVPKPGPERPTTSCTASRTRTVIRTRAAGRHRRAAA
jgi:hypothetical protein